MSNIRPLTPPLELEDTSGKHAIQHDARVMPERWSLPERLAIAERRLVIALDYGTTYTGVAFATPSGNESALNEIDIIVDWGPKMSNLSEVPSVLSYSARSEAKEKQWGNDLSPDAVAMIHTKLELDVDDVSEELDFILQALDGMKDLNFKDIIKPGGLPAYTDKSSEEIVTDYLEKIVERVLEEMLKSPRFNFSKELLDRISTDIVITIPTDWSYRAKNSTYRALTKAGFNKVTFPKLESIIFVTEPEAAAIYTARYLKGSMGQDFLKPLECFVLCDAGGGTVDVVSYKVKQLSPTLELERIGIPTGEKCGSIYIDLAFKEWLKNLLGEERYQQLDPNAGVKKISSHTIEGKQIRELMARFNLQKEHFEQDGKDRRLDLPHPLDNLNLPNRVDDGQITIPYGVMSEFFEACVDKIVKLIEGHIDQITRMKFRTKNIFLVGGFAESKYLQRSIEYSLDLRDIQVRRPDTSLTAVARGAVLCGIEKLTTKNLSKASSCRRHYAISVNQQFSAILHHDKDVNIQPRTNQKVAVGQLVWLFKKGDLVLSDEPKEVQYVITVAFNASEDRKGNLKIYSYDDDDPPERIHNSINELTVAKALDYDLSDIPLNEFGSRRSLDTGSYYYFAHLTLVMKLDGENLEAAIKFNNRELVRATDVFY